MNPEELKQRTKAFALRVVRLCERLPRSRVADGITKQLFHSGTSVGANYRAACRAKSPADFIAKTGIVEEEYDETLYWMGLLIESGLVDDKPVADLLGEANEILSIVVASIKTARTRKQSAIRDRQSAIGNPRSALRD